MHRDFAQNGQRRMAASRDQTDKSILRTDRQMAIDFFWSRLRSSQLSGYIRSTHMAEAGLWYQYGPDICGHCQQTNWGM
jgi:hypothetical protein